MLSFVLGGTVFVFMQLLWLVVIQTQENGAVYGYGWTMLVFMLRS